MGDGSYRAPTLAHQSMPILTHTLCLGARSILAVTLPFSAALTMPGTVLNSATQLQVGVACLWRRLGCAQHDRQADA